MDEEIQVQAENADVQESNVTESPAVEQQPEVQQEATAVDNQPEDTKPRNNAQSRLKEVLGERKQLKTENERLAQLLEQSVSTQIPDSLNEDEYRALQASATYAATEVQQLKRQMAQEKFTSEIDLVEQSFPELNPQSESYNEQLAESLAKAYEEGFIVKDNQGNFVGTKKSLKEFTEQMVAPYRKALELGAVKTNEVLSQQAGEAVVTPQTTSTSSNKEFKDLSIEEMEKQLGVVRN